VLGFLSVSTHVRDRLAVDEDGFQSRAGFSECLDQIAKSNIQDVGMFQSRAGFSECLDLMSSISRLFSSEFQSRAGFSECLDAIAESLAGSAATGFNPVLGFLSVSTIVPTNFRSAFGVSIPCWVF